MIELGTLDGRPCNVEIEGDGSEHASIRISLVVLPSEMPSVIQKTDCSILALGPETTLRVLVTSCRVVEAVDITSFSTDGSRRFAASLQLRAHMLRHLSKLPQDWPKHPQKPPETYW